VPSTLPIFQQAALFAAFATTRSCGRVQLVPLHCECQCCLFSAPPFSSPLLSPARAPHRTADEDYIDVMAPLCPAWAPLLGFAGCAFAVTMANAGGAYGTWRAGEGIMAMGINSPELLMKNIIPVVMVGVLGIYGIITSIIISGKIYMPDENGACRYSQFSGYAHLSAGVCVGLASLASGIALGIASNAGVRANGAQSAMTINWKKMGFSGANSASDKQNDALFVAGVLIQVFASNIGLYSLICALILTQMEYSCDV